MIGYYSLLTITTQLVCWNTHYDVMHRMITQDTSLLLSFTLNTPGQLKDITAMVNLYVLLCYLSDTVERHVHLLPEVVFHLTPQLLLLFTQVSQGFLQYQPHPHSSNQHA